MFSFCAGGTSQKASVVVVWRGTLDLPRLYAPCLPLPGWIGKDHQVCAGLGVSELRLSLGGSCCSVLGDGGEVPRSMVLHT